MVMMSRKIGGVTTLADERISVLIHRSGRCHRNFVSSTAPTCRIHLSCSSESLLFVWIIRKSSMRTASLGRFVSIPLTMGRGRYGHSLSCATRIDLECLAIERICSLEYTALPAETGLRQLHWKLWGNLDDSPPG